MSAQKKDFIKILRAFQKALRMLQGEVAALETERVSRAKLRRAAEKIVAEWVENIRSPLEYRFKISEGTIRQYSELIKRLNVLSRPNNLKTSYLEVIHAFLSDFEDSLISPVTLFSTTPSSLLTLDAILALVPSPAWSEYMKEAIRCASNECYRAAIVLGWCAGIDRMQSKVAKLGYKVFNSASQQMKAATSGRFKRWNKEFNISTVSELQEVFDNDLICVLEWIQLFDSNEATRLRACFEYRNQSAHPGNAPIDEPHLVAFFSDVTQILLANTKLE